MTSNKVANHIESHENLATDQIQPLYVSEVELHRLVSPTLPANQFRAALRLAETQGFPPIDQIWGGRYWPKVRAWLDKRNRLGEHDVAKMAEDGQENFDAPPRRHPGSQAKPQRPSLLDGETTGQGYPRISGPIHSSSRGR